VSTSPVAPGKTFITVMYSYWLSMVNSLAQLRFFVVASLSVFEAAASQ